MLVDPDVEPDLDYIMDDLEHEKDERKMRVAALRFKLELYFQQFSKYPSYHPGRLAVAYHLDQAHVSEFFKELKTFLNDCTEAEKKALVCSLKREGGHRSLYDVCWVILNSLEDKTQALDDEGNTALHLLADAGCKSKLKTSQNIGRTLEQWIQSLPVGPDRCPLNEWGRSPLHLACKDVNLDVDIVKVLCQYMTKDQIGQADCHGRTALRDACANSNLKVEIIQTLSEAMATEHFGIIDYFCYHGRTALQSACKNRYCTVEVVEILCQNMSQYQLGLQSTNDYQRTALHYACSNPNCDVEIVKTLCRYMSKDQIMLREKTKGPLYTALDLAKLNTAEGAPAIVKYLSEFPLTK